MALRIIFSNLSSFGRPNFIFIDEGWSSFDHHNLDRISPFLLFLRSLFDHVIIISHITKLNDHINIPIHISKSRGISHINFS
jgi:DNA repair exonuclease SbcCD ATPase subunit